MEGTCCEVRPRQPSWLYSVTADHSRSIFHTLQYSQLLSFDEMYPQIGAVMFNISCDCRSAGREGASGASWCSGPPRGAGRKRRSGATWSPWWGWSPRRSWRERPHGTPRAARISRVASMWHFNVLQLFLVAAGARCETYYSKRETHLVFIRYKKAFDRFNFMYKRKSIPHYSLILS
jgi:hypothetical protein